MTDRAVLDFIGFPVNAPGNLECRLQLGMFRDDGTWIDDGSRPVDPSKRQREKHRFVLSVGDDIAVRVAEQKFNGYEPPPVDVIEIVAAHERRFDVIEARRARLSVDKPELRLVVRALGFDLKSEGQISIGLGKVTVRPNGMNVTQKSGVLLYPGDPIDLVIEAANELAKRIDYAPLCAEDISLLRTIAKHLWTPERIAQRRGAWLAADAANGDKAETARMIEFTQRIDTMGSFRDIPTMETIS
jgi:hypothetical protein